MLDDFTELGIIALSNAAGAAGEMKVREKTTIDMSPQAFRELLVAASFYLGGAVERAKTSGTTREVVNIRGTFDELIDQIDADAEKARAGVCDG